MIDAWTVIGGPNTRKSSSIRALTGVRQIERKWNVAYIAHGDAATYVLPQGLQEIRVLPPDFIQRVNAAGVRYVIVALRYGRVGRHPDAAGYLAAFRAANWNIAGHVVLGAAALPGGFSIPNAPAMPSNEVAAQLRQVWGLSLIHI